MSPEDHESQPPRISLGDNDFRASASSETDPLATLLAQAAELYDFVIYFAAAKFDGYRVRLRNLVLSVLAGGVAVVLLIAMSISLWLYFLHGVAGGLAAMFGGDRQWIGDLVAGGLGMMMLALIVTLHVLHIRTCLLRERKRAYEERKLRQRQQHGSDTENVSREAA